MYQRLRPLLFRLDPERAHHLAMAAIQRGLVPGRVFSSERLQTEAFGVHFPNPLGLAAGMDKDGVALRQWGRLGFGAVEMGTVTLRKQSGNPRPRMFRLPDDEALVNRLGFNNGGAPRAAAALSHARRAGIPVGVNLGRNKDVENCDAADAYSAAARHTAGLGAWVTVNVSSPNTPGLRALQDGALLGEILAAVREADPDTPLLVKIAPDLEPPALDDILRVAVDARLAGIVATNTTLTRPVTRDPGEAGGLSGRPLRPLARAALRHLARQAPPGLTLIGVGGIMTAEDAWERLADGAHLLQSYTGFVYGGPTFAPDLLAGLDRLMADRGATSVRDVIGTGL